MMQNWSQKKQMVRLMTGVYMWRVPMEQGFSNSRIYIEI